jgi:hypoxanthine-guanine phosphoribosyltransferase
MSLFPHDDILAKVKEQWKGYLEAQRQEEREAFLAMIDGCYPFLAAIIAKGAPFSTDTVIMSMAFGQFKKNKRLMAIVQELQKKIAELQADQKQ